MQPLYKTWLNAFPQDLPRQKHVMLVIFLSAMVLDCLAFYFINSPLAPEHRWVQLATSAGLLILLVGYLWAGWSMRAVVHAMLLIGLALILTVTLQTGGINSPKLICIVLLPIPAVFFIGQTAALVWAGVVVLTMVIQAVATYFGVLQEHFYLAPQYIGWALLTKVTVMLAVFMIPVMYHVLHSRQMASVKTRNQELEKMREELVQAESYKDAFVAGVGHELRTPMNAILGFNDVLRGEVKGDAKAEATVDLIRDSTERLLKLTNHILDFSQLQAGRLQLQHVPVHLYEALHVCVGSFAQQPDSPVRFVTRIEDGLPAWVMTDPLRVKEILCHLLENAFKFTAQGEVCLSLRRQGDALRFDVIDSGVGIPLELQRIIFNRFEHADAETRRQFGGAGLGLSICERLVQLFGGEIGVRSQPGQGSHFWFCIPCQPCDAPSPPRANRPSQADAKFCILVVDDNAVNLQVAVHFCRTLWPQASVLTAHSAKSCLEQLMTSPVDIILMDMIMPDMDGAQATREIRTQLPEPICRIPILGLTASTHPSDHATCLMAGMNAVLHKPIDKLQLFDRVHALLSAEGVLDDA